MPPALRDALRAAAQGDQWPIYLHGRPGRGKSCAAACVYRRWRGHAIWCETSRVVADILECRSNGKGFVVRNIQGVSVDVWEGTIRRKVREAGLVVLDDFGLRLPSDSAYEALFNLVNDRLGKPLILTSNASPDELRRVYDDRMCSRVLRGAVVSVGGDDQRLKAAKTYKA